MRKIKILHVGMTHNLGGVESYCLNLLNNIDRDMFDLHFMNVGEIQIAYTDEILGANSKIQYITTKRVNFIKYIYGLINTFKGSNYDIIEFHMVSYRWFDPILIAQLFSNAKVILHAHTTRVPNYKVFDRVINLIGEKAVNHNQAALLACGEQAGKIFFKEKSHIIAKNAININSYLFDYSKRKKIRKELGFTTEFIIGHIGMFNYAKNHDFLIDMFYKVYAQNSNARLLLIGDGETLATIKEKISLLGLQNVIMMLGARQDVPSLLQAIDVLVLPSLYEGLPLVLVEAQAAGLKCYASKDSISSEVAITNNLEFITLRQGIDPWVDKLLHIARMGYVRIDQSVMIEAAGYSAKHATKEIENFYMNQVNGQEEL